MNRNQANTAIATAAAQHRDLYRSNTRTSELPFIVRRHADAFTLHPARSMPSIDSLWDMTLLDRVKLPLSRRIE